MKQKRYFGLSMIVGLALGALAVQADATQLQGGTKVQLSDVPAAAQNVIKAQAGSAQVEDIDKGTLDGKTVYEAAFKRNGQHTEVRVAEDGSLVDTIVGGQSAGAIVAAPTTAAATPAVSSVTTSSAAYEAGFAKQLQGETKVKLSDVPIAARQLIKQHAQGAPIEDIDKGRMPGGNILYQAAYKKNGQNVELRVNEQGTFVREVMDGKVIFQGEAKQAQMGTAITGGQIVALKDVPANVRQVARSYANGAALDTIRKGTADQKTVYQFTYMKNGQRTRLRVSEDGSTVREAAAGTITEGAGASK